jgi:hypothetical protein
MNAIWMIIHHAIMHDMSEKEKLEYAALKKFIVAYNVEHVDAPLHLVRVGDAPDSVVRLGTTEIGIEIAHAYGTQFDAQNALGRAGDIVSIGKDKEVWDRHIQNSTIPLGVRIPRGLNDVLRSKALKRYGGDTWLVIRNAFPLWSKSDFEKHRHLVRLSGHPYQQVWLMCGVESSDGILRLA